MYARRRAVALAVVLLLGFALSRLVAAFDDGPAEGVTAAGAPVASPSAAASPTPASTPSPVPTFEPSGELWSVPGDGAVVGTGQLQRYRIEVEGGVGVSGEEFAAAVEQVLSHPRSWTADGRTALQRVSGPDADIIVTLASPGLTDRLCAPLTTEGIYSCFNGERAVLNSMRWLHGDDSYGSDVARYRQYLVNHEVGHALGHGHEGCPAPGAPAPVMVQQTVSLDGCAPNPWPFG